MTDLLQAIAEIACADAFAHFNCDEATTLRRYHELCVALGESEFLREGVRFTFKASTVESYERIDHAGPTQLRSVMLDVRQLWMQRERTHFPSVRNMLRTHALARETSAAAEAVRQLDGIGSRHSEALKTTLMSFVDRENPMIHIKDISAEQVIDDWLYSGAAHWDEEKAARVNLWSKPGYELSLSKAVHAVCDVYWELDLLIQGILNEPSLVAPFSS